MAEHAVADVEQRAFLRIGRIVLDTLQQRTLLILHEVRRLRRAADGEGVDRSGSLPIGSALSLPVDAAPARRDGDVLLAVDDVGDRRGHDARAGRRLPQLLAGLGVVGDEAAVGGALEHEVASSGERAAVPRRYLLLVPYFLLLHRIPGDQPAEGLALRRLRIGKHRGIPAQPRRRLAGQVTVVRPVFVVHQVERHVLRRQVHQASARVERHRHPVVRAIGAGDGVARLVALAGFSHLDRTAALVVPGRPVDVDEVFRRDELAVGAVDDEKETVLRRVQNHLARPPGDLQVGEDHRLGRGVVPIIAGGFLVVPDVFARVRVECDDRCKVQVVATRRAALAPRPG